MWRAAVGRVDTASIRAERKPVKRAHQRVSVNFSTVSQVRAQVGAVRLDGVRFTLGSSIHDQFMPHERRDTNIASFEFVAMTQREPAIRIRHRAARLDHRNR
ncbi:hypothetical protein WT23_08015 [Burkholderia territorii]|nr:hypothetical protein WT22_19965 [Burkholderia territorii]KVQ67718.1 hypothetical protein WT23_08015 [Burkholderia territorii]KWA38713.1 hypothetical protein WT40_07505 [Burkholderia territorii]